MGDSTSAYAKCFSNANGVHFVGEIDAKIAFAVVQPLQHFDPSKTAVIEQDDGDGQAQAGDGRELGPRHTERTIAHHPNDAFLRSGDVGPDPCSPSLPPSPL